MNRLKLKSFTDAAYGFATALTETSQYIRRELQPLPVEPSLRRRIEVLCSHLLEGGTRVSDALEALPDISDTVRQDSFAREVGRLLQQPLIDLGELHKIVTELRARSKEDPKQAIVLILVQESATNVWNAYNGMTTAADELQIS